MRAFEIREFGIENLRLTERLDPTPATAQVLIRMKAASLNRRDLMVVRGEYNPKLRRPLVPLSDGSGVVEEIGPGVTRCKVGDRVTGIFMQSWVDGPPTREAGHSALGGAIDGVLAEKVVLHEDGLVKTPDFLSDEEAAALPCAAVTAWNALMEHAAPVPGQTVLLQGTGGVSLFALQFAKAAGMRVLLTSSSDSKISRAKQLGADELINYKAQPDWGREVRTRTGGVGVDRVVEVGGSGTIEHSLRAVRVGGMVSLIGVLSGSGQTVDPLSILMNSIQVRGIYVGSRAMFERMNRAIELHRIKPVIDREYAWTDYPEALRPMDSAQHFGKIVLRF